MDDHPQSVVYQLDPAVVRAMIPKGTIGLRVPDDELALAILRLCAGPIVLTSANRSGQPAATNGQEVQDPLGDDVDLVIE